MRRVTAIYPRGNFLYLLPHFIILTLACLLFMAAPVAVAQEAQDQKWEDLNKEVEKLYKQGRFQESLALARQELKLAEVQFGAELDESQQLWQRALEIYEKAIGPESTEVARMLSGLGGVAASRKDYATAESAYHRAITIREKILAPDDPTLATLVQNLGELYLQEKKFDQAEPLLRRAEAILEKRLGPNHPDLAIIISNIGMLEAHRKKFKEANQTLKWALTIQENALGYNHPLVALTLLGLTYVALQQGQCAEADSLTARALEIEEPHESDDLHHLIQALVARSKVLSCLGRTEEAAQLYQRAKSLQH